VGSVRVGDEEAVAVREGVETRVALEAARVAAAAFALQHHAFAKRRVAHARTRQRALGRAPMTDAVRSCMDKQAVAQMLEQIAAFHDEELARWVDWFTRLFEPILMALIGLVIGAVSNWVWQLPELMHSLNLVRHFDFIAASARIGFEKPNPEIFHWALREARCEPDEVIHVGDHLDADVQGALGVGISPVLIDRRERFTAADVPDGVRLIRSLAELLPIVDQRLAVASHA